MEHSAILRDFPILTREMNNHRLVYLDSAASSLTPAPVLEAMETYYRQSRSNVHRGIYRLSEEATAAYEQARSRVAGFIGAQSEEVIFVRNATEAINLLAATWGMEHIGPGDEIVVSQMEHHSNLLPWRRLADLRGASLRYLEVDDDGQLRLDEGWLAPATKLVAITHISNMLGTVNPIRQMADAAHAQKAVVVVDAAQSVPHIPVDVRDLGADFLAFSGHKALGPTGIGVLWGRRESLEAMPPYQVGGEMVVRVDDNSQTWNDIPYKFEAGTPDIAGAIGLAAAVGYLSGVSMHTIRQHTGELVAQAMESLQNVEGVRLLGPSAGDRAGLVSFVVDGIHPHDLAAFLDEQGIAIRSGHHCTQLLHDRFGLTASCRASFQLYNDEQDVAALVEAVRAARKELNR